MLWFVDPLLGSRHSEDRDGYNTGTSTMFVGLPGTGRIKEMRDKK